MNKQLAAKMCLPNPELFIVYYQDKKSIAAALTQERQAYDLADLIDGLVEHVPLFKSVATASKDGNIAYEIERIATEPSRYPVNVVLPKRRIDYV